jgi:hypothetical protein
MATIFCSHILTIFVLPSLFGLTMSSSNPIVKHSFHRSSFPDDRLEFAGSGPWKRLRNGAVIKVITQTCPGALPYNAELSGASRIRFTGLRIGT